DGGTLVSLSQTLQQLVVDAFVYDYPACCGTPLACRTNGTKNDAAGCEIQIGRWANNDGIITAQLKQRAAKPGCHARAYGAPHPGRTRCRDQGNFGVVNQNLTLGLGADNHLKQTLGHLAVKARQGTLEQGLASQCTEGSLFRR